VHPDFYPCSAANIVGVFVSIIGYCGSHCCLVASDCPTSCWIVCCALCLFVSLLCGRERFLCRLVESRIIVRLQDMSYLSLNYDHKSIVRLQDMSYLSLNYDHRSNFPSLHHLNWHHENFFVIFDAIIKSKRRPES
jgi:hypothetical protein